MDKRIIHIFWTGGLDSTYRVVELSRKECVIQPHYIVLTGRQTVKNELKAISEITTILNCDKRTIAEIRPVKIFPMGELVEYADILSAWVLLHERKGFNSTQYPLLARYARQEKKKVEMGIQFSENGTVSDVVDESYLVDCPDHDDVMMIDPVKGDQEWASFTLFQDFLFPKSLYHKTKKEEIEELKDWGYDKVLKKVWTCFHPVFGMPCGHCFACESAIKEGAGEIVPLAGYVLGGIRQYYGKILKRSKKIVRRILPQKVYEMLRSIYKKE
jgi:7-cyano-7-deazaguanine synthase